MKFLISDTILTLLSIGIGMFITIMNMILKKVVAYMVTLIGFHTRSKVATFTVNALFFNLYLNTAIMLLIVNADF